MELSEIQYKEPPRNKAEAQKRAKALAAYLKVKIGGNWKPSIGQHKDEWRSWALCGTMKVFSEGLDEEPESPLMMELYGCNIREKSGRHVNVYWQMSCEDDPVTVVNFAIQYLRYDAKRTAKQLKKNLAALGRKK